MYTLYGDIISGNCYKIYLLMNLLNIDFKWKPIDIMQGDTANTKFRIKNANAKVPLLEIEKDKYLAESNAILNYFAENTEYLPDDQFLRAKVLEWQFFEQYSHEPYIAVARFIKKYQGLPQERLAEYNSKQPGGHKALSIMNMQLNQTPYLIGEQYTIADISLFAYTHVAHEGGFDLSRYSAILKWIKRIQSHPKHVAMELKEKHHEPT